jgi:hypothetical protein
MTTTNLFLLLLILLLFGLVVGFFLFTGLASPVMAPAIFGLF